MAYNTILLPAAVAVATLASAGALVNYVELQATSPGVAQAGNINVTGSVFAGKVGVGTTSSPFPLAVSSLLDTTGVWSKTAGTAISGQSTKAGTGYGGYFSASGTSARAVFGEATSFAGAGYGGYFVSRSLQGTGVYGVNNNTTGINYGVRGRADGNLSWAGYFDGRGFFSGPVGIGTNTPTAGLMVNTTVNGIGFNASNALFTVPSVQFVGVNRSDRVSGSEYFGVYSPAAGAQFGGMYVKTKDNTGKPYYGYSSGGAFSAYHYWDPASSSWILNTGSDRFYFDATGQVGIGAVPTAPLDIKLGTNNLKIVNDGNLVPGIVATGTGGNQGVIRLRNQIEVHPNPAGTVPGYLDVRNTAGAPMIALDGTTGKGTFFDNLIVDGSGVSTGTTARALLFGGAGSGEAISSARTGGTNVNGLDLLTGGSRRFSITNAGLVGVGTTAPTANLDVRGNFALTSAAAAQRLIATIDAADFGFLATYGANATRNFAVGAGSGGANTGTVVVYDSAGAIQAGIDVSGAGVGTVYGDVKSFKVVNPRDNKSDIWYASIEGPEAAMYVRGKGVLANGRAHVMFPEHFIDMAVLEGMTVQLTANSFESEGLAYANLTITGFDVGELHKGRGSYGFDWEVKCVRKEHEDFKVIRPWDSVFSPSEPREQAWAARMRSIEAKKGNRPPRP